MFKNFITGFREGMESFGTVASGAIGGMAVMRGCIDSDTCLIVLGVILIAAAMLVNDIVHKAK